MKPFILEMILYRSAPNRHCTLIAESCAELLVVVTVHVGLGGEESKGMEQAKKLVLVSGWCGWITQVVALDLLS